MEIVLVTRSIYPLHGFGGMERHCHDWIQAMSDRGCMIHAITMPPARAEALEVFGKDVGFYFIPGKPARKILQRITSYPAWVKRVNVFLKDFTQKKRVRAIYAHGLAAAACEGIEIPAIYNPHGMEEFKTTGLKYLAYMPFRSLSRKGAALAHKVIATDKVLVPEIERYLGVRKNRIVVIPNAVHLDSWGSSASRIPYQGDPLFVAAGRLEANKGFPILIQALAHARKLPVDWRLVIVGAGSQEQHLKSLAQRVGLTSRIAFAGEIEEAELNTLLSQADLFLNPTLFEGSSIVTLEAMKHALPIVASATGGIPDKIKSGVNGWLVPPGDAKAFAGAIEKACAQRDAWKTMGAESRRIVTERFSWDVAATRFLDLFANCP